MYILIFNDNFFGIIFKVCIYCGKTLQQMEKKLFNNTQVAFALKAIPNLIGLTFF
jgi:hypothetical protein